MTTRQPQMSREFVNVLFDWYADYDYRGSNRFIYNCLRINSHFFEEGIKRLWHYIGYCGEARAEDLASIAKQSIERAQIYANEVHWLECRDFCGGNVPDGHNVEILSRLNYPKNTVVYLHTRTVIEVDETALIAFLQPSVENFTMNGAFVGTFDTFLDVLHDRCPDLKELGLHCEKVNFKKLEGYLERSPQLQTLQIHTTSAGWSLDTFKLASQLQELRTLDCPNIEAQWMNSVFNGFPSLCSLHATMSVDAVEKFHAIAPTLRYLTLNHLKNTTSSSRLFKAASLYQKLVWFEVNLDALEGSQHDGINGEDLVLLAERCPKLACLRVVGQESHPVIHGITDEVMKRFAQRCCKLEDFFWLVDDTSSPSFDVLRSLGKHCRKIECIRISVNASWDSLRLEPGPKVLFKNLIQLWLAFRGDEQKVSAWAEDSMNIKRLAGFLGPNTPSLHPVVLIAGSGLENNLEEAMTKELREQMTAVTGRDYW
ncbi:hypothetical protein N0V90_010215 [Kalmusia sp. IMI 367209]|nr:hypothetical protein N0V90_010215 [Kalmusia sp. IMI 367209]